MSPSERDKKRYQNGFAPKAEPVKPKKIMVEWAVWAEGDIIGFVQMCEDMPKNIAINGMCYELKGKEKAI